MGSDLCVCVILGWIFISDRLDSKINSGKIYCVILAKVSNLSQHQLLHKVGIPSSQLTWNLGVKMEQGRECEVAASEDKGEVSSSFRK